MTSDSISRIAALRRENYSYSFIGELLSLSPNTVKSICRRKNLIAEGSRKTKAEKVSAVFCKNCSKPISVGTRKGSQFCSDVCRAAWWRRNRKIVEKQT